MLASARMIVDAAFGQFAELGAHGREKLGVDVVVEIGERELLERHRTGPVLVVLELGHGQLQRLEEIVARAQTRRCRGAEEARILGR